MISIQIFNFAIVAANQNNLDEGKTEGGQNIPDDDQKEEEEKLEKKAT